MLIKSLSDFILEFLCNARNGGDANSELFKELHDEAVHKNSYKSRLCELISASLDLRRQALLDPGPAPAALRLPSLLCLMHHDLGEGNVYPVLVKGFFHPDIQLILGVKILLPVHLGPYVNADG